MLKLFAGALLAAAAVAPAQAGPFDGTWKIDAAATKFDQKPEIYRLRGTEYECVTCTPPYKVKADGRIHKVTGRDYADAQMVKIVDASTIRSAMYKSGKMYAESTSTVSADGQTLTSNWRNNNNPQKKWVSGTVTAKRAAPAVAGMHAVSGSWSLDRTQPADPGTFTLAVNGDTVTWKGSYGGGYTAKLGGPAVPIVGDPSGTTVAIKRVGDAMESTYYLKGKAVSVDTATPIDANSFKIVTKDLRAGWVDEVTFRRQ